MEFHCGQLRIPVRKHVFKRELNSPLILEVPGHSFRLLAFVGTDIIWSWIPDKSLWWDGQNFIPCANWFSLLSIDYMEEGKLQGKGTRNSTSKLYLTRAGLATEFERSSCINVKSFIQNYYEFQDCENRVLRKAWGPSCLSARPFRTIRVVYPSNKPCPIYSFLFFFFFFVFLGPHPWHMVVLRLEV